MTSLIGTIRQGSLFLSGQLDCLMLWATLCIGGGFWQMAVNVYNLNTNNLRISFSIEMDKNY